jgi:protein-L-isoaspartate(D-aspartate) O-methyltransferase
MIDNYKHRGLRKRLVSQLREKGIKNEAVLTVIGQIPRHFFLDNAFEEIAYQDKAFSIGFGQTISQPYTVAYQTELLNLSAPAKILEIGTGSGYQAIVLAALGHDVHTIERQEGLYTRTNLFLKQFEDLKPIKCYLSDGSIGMASVAPFDAILVTCGAETIPEALCKQLKIGGVMVIPVGADGIQKMMRITRLSEKDFQTERFGDFRFVPLLDGVESLKS